MVRRAVITPSHPSYSSVHTIAEMEVRLWELVASLQKLSGIFNVPALFLRDWDWKKSTGNHTDAFEALKITYHYSWTPESPELTLSWRKLLGICTMTRPMIWVSGHTPIPKFVIHLFWSFLAKYLRVSCQGWKISRVREGRGAVQWKERRGPKRPL